MPVDRLAFTRTMSRVPAPVTVATTADASGRRWGFTGSSFSSLSLDPPLVLICLDKGASTHGAFTSASHFLINVLAHDQSDVALRFATSGVDRFEAGDMTPCELGLPGLPEAAARIACTTHEILDGGDHSILVGRVEATHAGDRAPLVYTDRAFGRPVPNDQMAATG
ncbi:MULTISPECIES: flavin reductase family protein [unclassified Streptomyces]|jgi:flavin reductase (DIM6/NTAB) family NADH-FMN oxidoreductase RutF|uniref:flavin reductase family protein n=1 Tax=unclassified Streptomyces TaxID=2593676 RepID=UPI00296614B5|nr:flavin reductase family protein [Streptomyces sp. SCL15-4]